MIITCDKCSTSFNLDESLLSPEGSKVRCSVCKNIFTARPQTAEPSAGTEESPADLSLQETDQEIESLPEEPSSFEVKEEDFSLEEEDLEMEETDLEIEDPELEEPEPAEEDDFSFEDNVDIDEADDPGELELEEESAIEFDDDGDDDLILEQEDASLEFDYDDDDGLEFETIDDEDDDLILEDDAVPLEEDDDLSLEMEVQEEPAPEETKGSADLDEETNIEQLSLENDEEEEFELDFDVQDSDDDAPPAEPEPDTSLEDSPENSDMEQDGSQIHDNTAPESEEDAKEPPVITPEDDFSQYDEILDQETEPEIVASDNDETHGQKETETKDLPQQTNGSEDAHTPLITPSSGAKRRRKKKKSAVGAPVLVLVLAFLLVTGAYVASKMTGYKIPYLSDLNIAFIDQYLKTPETRKPALKPVPNQKSVNGRFVTNSSAGTLFVITGRVKNPSDTAYSYIEVKGALITKGKKQARTKTAFCGNILTEETLKNSNIADINKKLSVKSGNHNSNINIKPGANVPFMIVFSNLPEKLQNFTVKVVGFKKEKKK